MTVWKNLLLLLFLTTTITLNSQTLDRIGLEGQYGFIIPHSPDLSAVSQTHPRGFVIDYQRMQLNENNWQACNCFHYLGLQFSYHDFANPEVLGAAYTLSGTFEPILKKLDKWEISLKTGMGVGYLSRVYNAETNPENTFFSTPISFLAFLAPKVTYSFSSPWQLSATFNYNHISNGGQREPNRGMNYPTLGVGLSYRLRDGDYPEYQQAELSQNWQGYLEGGFTTRDAAYTEGRKAAINVAVGALKPITPINGFGGGLELTQDFAVAVESSRWEGLMPAPYIAHHFMFGRFDFSQRMALYTHKPEGYIENRFYQRYLVQYKILPRILFGISLKVHGHVAENMDLRIGWRF